MSGKDIFREFVKENSRVIAKLDNKRLGNPGFFTLEHKFFKPYYNELREKFSVSFIGMYGKLGGDLTIVFLNSQFNKVYSIHIGRKIGADIVGSNPATPAITI